jgi:hypothetical protein
LTSLTVTVSILSAPTLKEFTPIMCEFVKIR